MSRYIKLLANGRSVAYGFDRPLGEFFLTEFLSKRESDEAEAFNQDLIEKYGPENVPWCELKPDEISFGIGSYNTMAPHPNFPDRQTWSNGEILELMATYPEGTFLAEHLNAIAMDIPF